MTETPRARNAFYSTTSSTPTHIVTATHVGSGASVYLSSETYLMTMKTLLILNNEPVVVSERAAARLAELASKDETLIHVSVERIDESRGEGSR